MLYVWNWNVWLNFHLFHSENLINLHLIEFQCLVEDLVKSIFKNLQIFNGLCKQFEQT